MWLWVFFFQNSAVGVPAYLENVISIRLMKRFDTKITKGLSEYFYVHALGSKNRRLKSNLDLKLLHERKLK